MEALIKERLRQLESEKGIRILYACESGSRAWGFPSPDSDYDVRFFYRHPRDWYLSLREREDTINLPINDELDITGWDLRKALKLLFKSNASPLEWMQSPIVYSAQDNFLQEFRPLASGFFSPIGGAYHYHSIARRYWESCQGEEVKLKSYFYVLRTMLAAHWIVVKHSVPPILFAEMLSLAGEAVRKHIEELILLKAGKTEAYLHQREPLLDDFIRHILEDNERSVNNLPGSAKDGDAADEFFLKWIS